MKLFLTIAVSYFLAQFLLAYPWQVQVVVVWELFVVPTRYLMDFLFMLGEHY